MKWGVPVPIDGADDKVLYVWFDAPIGYISATKELLPNNWEDYWKNSESRLVHFIGKDNIVFHCIIFPAMLMQQGEYILPQDIPANEFLNLEGQKLSTSRNWAVWLHEYLEDFSGKQDVLRYVLCATAPETKDNDFTWRDFQARNNNELVAVLGNFMNRVYVLVGKNYDGAIPSISGRQAPDEAVLRMYSEQFAEIKEALSKYRFRDALNALMGMARLGNKYLADEEPWKKAKTDPERAAVILGVACRLAAFLGQVMGPFIPFTADRVMKSFGQEKMGWKDLDSLDWTSWLEGQSLTNPGLLFEKIEDETIEQQLEKLNAHRKEQPQKPLNVPPMKDLIEFDDFQKMDIRVGRVLTAERVPKTDKLIQMRVDTGVDERTVISGIAEHYAPEDMVGKQVTILLNLKPRKIRGIESQGMLLFAEDENGRLHITAPSEELSPGSSIG
jgi:methionyl-tRNA synthetase